ncbi:MAG: helix-turn-helix domain-containing protein [Pseudobdellovibrionaceae bacterium]
MSKSLLILVSDNADIAQSAKVYWEQHNVQFQVYSVSQWKEGLNNGPFRLQLGALPPTLSSGANPIYPTAVSPSVVHISPTTSSGSVFSNSVVNNSVQKIEHMEAIAIEKAIVQFKGNLTEAAKALGIGRATLYRKVKQYHIDLSHARHKKIAA